MPQANLYPKKASHAELKNLQTQYGQLNSEMAVLKNEIKEKQAQANKLQNQASSLKNRIDALTAENKPLIISEHAYLRYFERVIGYNMDDVRKMILTEEREKAIRAMGEGVFPVETPDEKYRLVVKDGVVVSVVTKEGQK